MLININDSVFRVEEIKCIRRTNEDSDGYGFAPYVVERENGEKFFFEGDDIFRKAVEEFADLVNQIRKDDERRNQIERDYNIMLAKESARFEIRKVLGISFIAALPGLISLFLSI